jgi:hypothetical protein
MLTNTPNLGRVAPPIAASLLLFNPPPHPRLELGTSAQLACYLSPTPIPVNESITKLYMAGKSQLKEKSERNRSATTTERPRLFYIRK